MLIDHHTHTKAFSFDGIQSPDELLYAAKARGLDGVCLSEHYDKDVAYINEKEAIFDLDAYHRSMPVLTEQARFLHLHLLYGIELGYLPHLNPYFARIVLRYPFDAVILSLHLLDGEDPYSDRQIYKRGRDLIYGRYLEQLTEMMTACPDFDILGHFDYITRYADWPNQKILWREQPDRFDALFRKLISMGKTLELNTSTMHTLRLAGYDEADSWPDTDIFYRYLELGGELVCLSSDAHAAQDVGLLLDEARQWLKNIGFRYLTHYSERQPVMTLI
ncbi:MAG: histidinol-phosphatase HisJ family protein [Clostridia bacterium]|nr:histidinol-phosphatase HisJ family protein [Clostridia bacterium]